MKSLRPFSRSHRLLQRFVNWLDALTMACADNGWWWFAVMLLVVAVQVAVFHPETLQTIARGMR